MASLAEGVSGTDKNAVGEDFQTPIVKSEAVFFTERDECLALINTLVKSSMEASVEDTSTEEDEEGRGPKDDASRDAIVTILNKYQEESAILDPSLSDMVIPLMAGVRGIIANREAFVQKKREAAPTVDGVKAFPYQRFVNPSLHRLFQVLYNLCKVRGYKRIVRLMPHEVHDVEPTMHLLLSQDQGDYTTWETRYILLLWMSMLVMVPFDLTTIDSSSEEDGATGGYGGLIEGIIGLCKHYLGDPGPTRDAASVCLSKLLTRPDMEAKHLTDFLTWSNTVVGGGATPDVASFGYVGGGKPASGASVPGGPGRKVFLSTGVLTTLVMVFKVGHRDRMEGRIPLVAECMHVAAQAMSSGKASTLQRKLTMKLSQRVGLQYMPPRLVKWRYQRGQRSLLDNLSQAGVAAASEALLKESTADAAHDSEEEEDDEDVPEEMEEVIEQLLIGLRDKDTVVRWSAAKGIGRISGRLPRDFADDVVGEVLNLFSDGEGDGAWHGGCLALAELARRGLLVPDRLPEVVPVVMRAIVYDLRRARHSIGSHVRDAACYVCWAFARAYAPDVLKPHVLELSRGMLITALFDREVNCRRAASAAFQENVGRQGHENFVHGIDIVTEADYFALGNRNHSYLNLGPFIAKYSEYCRSVIDHLASQKVQHWDVGMRTLTAATLAKIAPFDPQYFIDKIIPEAMKKCLNRSDLDVRHGNTILVAELILTLSKIPNLTLPEPVLKTVRNLVPMIEKARLYRGRGGEIMRGAACRLLECMALAQHPLTRRAQLRMIETVNECLKHPNPDISEFAVGALRAMTKEYFTVKDTEVGAKEFEEDITAFPVKYCDIMRDNDNPGARRGFVLALGVLPYSRWAVAKPDIFQRVLDTVVMATRKGAAAHERDAETRRNAVRALGDMCVEVAENMTDEQLTSLYEAVLSGVDDYAVDSRGDVGSWVRVASMNALPKVLGAIVKRDMCLGSTNENASPGSDDIVVPSIEERAPESLTNAVDAMAIGGKPSTPTGFRKRFYTPLLAVRAIRGILRQLSEKIDSVRECAGKSLEQVVLMSEPQIPNIPSRTELLELVDAQQIARYVLPQIIYPRVVKMLNLELYRESVLAGVVHSAGDVNEGGARGAREALLMWAKERAKSKNLKDLYIVADNIFSLLKTGLTRLVVPALKSIAMLLKNGCFDMLDPANSPFFDNILKYSELLIQKTREPNRLLASLEVLLGLLSFDAPICSQAVAAILLMIGHPYPIVRARAAQELYTATLTFEDVILPEGDEAAGEEATEILISTNWAEMDHPSAVAVRDQLYPLLQVEKSEGEAFEAAAKGITLQKGYDSWGNDNMDRVDETPFGTFASLVRELHG
jgi:hypothetical protein